MQDIPCVFPPTPDMLLDEKKLHVCAYLFNPNKDPSEVVFQCGNHVGTRLDFQVLCPNRPIDDMVC